MIAVLDPQASRRRDGRAKAMPPLWQYFSRLGKADDRIAAPKGRLTALGRL
jgi:hypothetical protein